MTRGASVKPEDVELRSFGYEIFNRHFGMLETIDAVDPDYPVGPGDEIVITAWGQVEFSYSLKVDRNGGISVPSSGLLQVSGVPVEKLSEKILRHLSKSYSTIKEDVSQASTFVDVTMGNAAVHPVQPV